MDLSPRAAALLFARALQRLDRIQPAAARAPIAAMLEAGIEQCATLRTLLGQPVNHLLDLARALTAQGCTCTHEQVDVGWGDGAHTVPGRRLPDPACPEHGGDRGPDA